MKLAIFDLDGTILDTIVDMHECLMNTLTHYELPLFDINTTKSYVGDGIRQLVIRAAGEKNFRDEMEKYFRKVYADNMTNKTHVIQDYDVVFNCLKQNNIHSVILSNKIVSLTGGLVKHFGLDKYFEKWYGGDSFGVKKPSPVPVQSIVKDYGAGAEQTLMIGDNHTDIESGYYAGVKTCFCTFGYGSLSDVKPDFTADKPADIVDALKEL